MQSGSIGPDGLPTQEVKKRLKPEYFASFSEQKELTCLNVSYMNWEKAEKPVGIEEVKKISKDFLIKNRIAEEEKLELMGASGISEERGVVFYQTGKEQAVIVMISTFSGKVEQFTITTPERARIMLEPKEEGYGIG